MRKDLLKTKYNFVNFAAAEEYKNWCSHYSQCTTWASADLKSIAPGFDQIVADISEQNPKDLVDLINETKP